MEASEKFWKSRRAVGLWLLSVALVILAMITIGGLTRLTGSGLSITEWKPIMGVLPPMSDAAWADAFAKYQRIPQYLLENRGMGLEAFKVIFWWEWSHRFLGRFLGLMFLVPFLYFAAVGAIRRSEWPGTSTPSRSASVPSSEARGSSRNISTKVPASIGSTCWA